jgi:protein TonB
MKNFMNSNDEFRFNEILFENRNKRYGAYALRMEEGNMLKKSLLIGVAFFACVSITPIIINSLKGAEIAKPPEGVEVVLREIIVPTIKKPEIVKATTPVAPPKVNTYDSRVATPTRDAKESKDPAPPKDSNAVPGTQNIVEPPPTTIIPPKVDVVVVPEVVKPVIIDTSPPKVVDVEANFIGGINSFRTKVVQNFDNNSFEGSGDLMKTTITFIVEKDGSISNIKSKGPNSAFNKEAEQTIKNIKGKWNPAKLKGENVRSYFNFPISMQFE